MMFSRRDQANSHSPQSSCGGVESIQGTPNTNLTAVTPDDPRGKGKGKCVEQTGAAFNAAVNHDPFVSGSGSSSGGTIFTSKEQKLSATALAFHPATKSSATSSTTIKAAAGPLPGTLEHVQQAIAQHAAEAASTTCIQATSYGTFSTDAGIGRCFKVTDAFQTDAAVACRFTVDSLGQRGVDVGKDYKICSSGQSAYLRFPNIRDAGLVFAMIKQDHPSFVVEYITPVAFGQVASPNSNAIYSAHEGQILLEAKYPTKVTIDKFEFEDSLRAALSAEGEIYAWQKLLASEAGSYRMVAEFVDSTVASRAVKRCNGKTAGNVQVKVRLHTPDIAVVQPSALVATTPTRGVTDQSNIGDMFGQMSLNNPHGLVVGGNGTVFGPGGPSPVGMTYIGTPQTPMSLMMGYPRAGQSFQQVYSPTTPLHQGSGSSLVGFSPAYAHYGVAPTNLPPTRYAHGLFSPNSSFEYTPQSSHGRRPFMSPSPTRRFGHGSGHHNHVDTHRIEQGIDVRTTVMLRNIPNKVDQQMLKSIVDESSHGRYDFMYLRIDFSNNCNVGYAFINFVDPLDIIDFVNARSNQKWDRFKSDKVAEVSYATIQGRDCLVQKFRNSSVMLEPPHFRPKLFFTVHDPFGRAGEEEEFPASDNASKLRRSCENAEHVGLFAPSAGQNMREEQRRRRSQYDRGTSLAEREEYHFDESEYVFPRSYAGPSRY